MAPQEHAPARQPAGPLGAERASYHESEKKKSNWQQNDRPQLNLYVNNWSAKAQNLGISVYIWQVYAQQGNSKLVTSSETKCVGAPQRD